MMKLIAVKGSMLSCGWLLPVIAVDCAFIEAFAEVPGPNGGDGQSTFGLPNLLGRVPVHQGQGPGLSNYVPGRRAALRQLP